MSTITHLQAGTVLTPEMVVFPWSDTTEVPTIFHTILGRESGEPDVTLRPASLRSGSYLVLFSTVEAAQAARDLHRVAGTLRLDDASVTLRYSPTSLTLSQEGDRWALEVGFQEVGA